MLSVSHEWEFRSTNGAKIIFHKLRTDINFSTKSVFNRDIVLENITSNLRIAALIHVLFSSDQCLSKKVSNSKCGVLPLSSVHTHTHTYIYIYIGVTITTCNMIIGFIGSRHYCLF